jgi:segregation and condensation protein B
MPQPFPLGAVARGPLARRRPDRLPIDAAPRRLFLGEPRKAEPAPQDPLARDDETARVEAVLMIADEPLPPRKIAQAAELADAAAARRVLQILRDLLMAEGSAFELLEVAGGFQLLTRPEFARWLSSLRKSPAETRLSAAARETLAIVAYRQPIGRADVEGIRGVHCGETLRLLMEKGFVKIAGRDDSLGRPVLYGTTKRFLQTYGLRSLRELPRREQLTPPEKRSETDTAE